MAEEVGFSERFEKFSQRVTHAVGRPWAFLVALLVIIVWAVTGHSPRTTSMSSMITTDNS